MRTKVPPAGPGRIIRASTRKGLAADQAVSPRPGAGAFVFFLTVTRGCDTSIPRADGACGLVYVLRQYKTIKRYDQSSGGRARPDEWRIVRPASRTQRATAALTPDRE